MFLDDAIHQAYLEELQSLESFRAAYLDLHGDTPLESEDPHTRRLIESLAFFGARSRLQGIRKITQIHQCLFRQYFPYLMNPLPAACLLQIKPSLRFPEKVVLPAGTELFFKTSDKLKASFQTLDPLPLLPLFFKKFDFKRREKQGWRCTIEYSSPHASTEEIQSFTFYVNHLNSFFSSARVAFAMQHTLEKIHIFYDGENPDEEGQRCSVSFGAAQQREIFNHPLEKVRSFLHFPEQELFMTLSIPPRKKRWQSVAICFDFDDRWPESLRLTSDSFVPFVVPAFNLKTGVADPIICDGTKDSYPLLYPEPMLKYKLHTVLSVSEILSSGARPLKPGILGDGGGSYEIDYFEQKIMLNLPQAFTKQKTITVNALWTQSWFSDYLNDELELQFADEQILGLGVHLLGQIHRYENTFEDDPNFLLKILSLKNQNVITLSEIFFLFNAIKKMENSYFNFVPDLIKNLKINQRVEKKGMGQSIQYEFELRDWGRQKWELVVLFFKYLNTFLNCWLSNFDIETKVIFPQAKEPLIIKRGKENELSVLARDFFLS